MCCILCIAAFISCRAAIFVTWLTGWYGQAYESTIWPLLGFLFMPWTALCYAGKVNFDGSGEWPVSWTILMVIAVLVDLGVWGGSGTSSRSKE